MFRPSCPTSTPRFRRPTPRRTAPSRSAARAAAEQSLRASNLDIVNTVNTVKTDVALTNLAERTCDGAGCLSTTAADAPHANLAEIGAIFNDAADKILGGVNDANRAEITDDINAVITDMEALISANPQLFEGLTGEHADAVVRQLQLELTYINDPNISPDAARASIDNILDIIDIVQSDPKLADMATQDGVSGFSPLPDAANPAPTHLENDVQTVFAANFIAQSNSLGQQAIDLVGSGDTKAIATLIADLKAFEKFVADFDAAQGGNALLDATGALGAEVAAMIKGLQTGDATLVTAAADQMHGNAADVGGNNVPVTGGTLQYRWRDCRRSPGDGAGGRNAGHRSPQQEPAPAHAAAPTIGVEPVTLATADVTVGVEDHAHSGMPDLAHHYITRGDSGARRGLRRPRCSGDAGGRYIESSNAFADPAHAADAEKRLSAGLRPQGTILGRWPQ